MTPVPGSLYRDSSDLYFVLQSEYYIFDHEPRPVPCWIVCCYTTIVNRHLIEWKRIVGTKEEYYT